MRDVAATQFRRILGPYDVFGIEGPVPKPIVEFDCAEVRGGQLAAIIESTENLSGTNQDLSIVLIDVAIVGKVQGQEVLLARQYLRQRTGPLLYTFDDAAAFTSIQVRARNMTGGTWGVPNVSSLQAAGNTAQLTIFIQPRVS